jgi:hypothetical protein
MGRSSLPLRGKPLVLLVGWCGARHRRYDISRVIVALLARFRLLYPPAPQVRDDFRASYDAPGRSVQDRSRTAGNGLGHLTSSRLAQA